MNGRAAALLSCALVGILGCGQPDGPPIAPPSSETVQLVELADSFDVRLADV